jgi:glycosyltransferase involved in cell wall biosynthesis
VRIPRGSGILPSVPAAAVVIPTRNRRRALERAITSVCSQTLNDWELVVVDDASVDDTWRFLSRLEDPRIRVDRLVQHAERSQARNRGLELVSSPAVLFLDDDDELLPEALELLTQAAARHQTACASVGACLHEIEGVRRRPGFPKRSLVLDVRLELLAGWVALGGQSLIRRSVLNEVGRWRCGLSVAEDQELWLRLVSRGPVAIVPAPVLVHHPHGLAADAVDARDVERDVVSAYVRRVATDDSRTQRAATAREHLRDAYVNFELGRYRTALLATARGIIVAPFLLASPLVGPGIALGFVNALVAAVLPRRATNQLRGAVGRMRAAQYSAR